MFDYQAHFEQQSGKNSDRGLLATFRYENVNGENIPYINIFLGKNDTVDRPATDEDKKRFRARWEAFLEGANEPPEGMPINHVPFATPANISACKAEKIFTVEQLLETPDSRLQRAYLLEFRYKCGDMMKQLKDSEHIIRMREDLTKLTKMVKALEEQNIDLKRELSERKKPRGRPRKKASDDADTGSE